MKSLAFRALMVLLLVVLGSAAYNALYIRYTGRHGPPGKLYQVNDSPMHLYCTGTGSPTVVLESGLGDDWLVWHKVQPEIAKTTRVCSYDRAGLGWSDLQPGRRDATNIAAQLHGLLQQAHVETPFVLVGASAGGFYAREFASDFPQETAALVFVDSSVPGQIEALPTTRDTPTKRRARHRRAMVEWLKEASGWSRIRGHCKGDVPRGLESFAAVARKGEACRPSSATSWLGEADEFWGPGAEKALSRCCGDMPLVIISQDTDRSKPALNAPSISAQTWNSLQDRLKTLSPRSRRIIARGSGHPVMLDRPDVVINSIRQLVLEIRDKVGDPQEGTTVVQ